MKLLAVLGFGLIMGCSTMQPAVDECQGYNTEVKQQYCYASKEVSSARRSVAQSLLDGAITKEQAIRARDILNEADAGLDVVESLILAGQEVEARSQLTILRAILLRLQ